MDQQGQNQSLPESPEEQPVKAVLDTSTIYPEITKDIGPSSASYNQYGDPSERLSKEESKLNNYPPLGVIIISLVILLQSAAGIWLAIANRNGGFYTIVYGLQLLLGLGLLTLHEIARLIYVALGCISLALQIPALLFFTSVSSVSSNYKLYSWLAVGVEVFVLVYLTRPSIKSHFG